MKKKVISILILSFLFLTSCQKQEEISFKYNYLDDMLLDEGTCLNQKEIMDLLKTDSSDHISIKIDSQARKKLDQEICLKNKANLVLIDDEDKIKTILNLKIKPAQKIVTDKDNADQDNVDKDNTDDSKKINVPNNLTNNNNKDEKNKTETESSKATEQKSDKKENSSEKNDKKPTPSQQKFSFRQDIHLLVNKQNALPNGYQAPLKEVPAYYAVSSGYQAHPEAVNAFVSLSDAMQNDIGRYVRVTSSYRTQDFQRRLYENYKAEHGETAAQRFSAFPGYSEHQTGLAIDVVGNNGQMFSFGETKESYWINENAYRFGFIVRYPAGKEAITGYMAEPWHLRYVGKDVAEFIKHSGLTYEEFYSNHFQ